MPTAAPSSATSALAAANTATGNAYTASPSQAQPAAAQREIAPRLPQPSLNATTQHAERELQVQEGYAEPGYAQRHAPDHAPVDYSSQDSGQGDSQTNAPHTTQPNTELSASKPVAAEAVSENLGGLTRQFDGDWRGLVDRLKLGLARALAQNCEVASFDEDSIAFSVPPTQKHLLGMGYEEKLQAAVQQHFGRKIKLSFAQGGSGNTPAQQMSQEKAALQSHAENAIHTDGFVQALIQDLGAQIIPSSIKPYQPT